MIGDMFNQGLKHRVDALCNELTDFLRSQPLGGVEAARFQSQRQSGGEEVSLYVAGTGSASGWWPEELGSPSSTGAQDDMRYACFSWPAPTCYPTGLAGTTSTTPASIRFLDSPSNRAAIGRFPSRVRGGTPVAVLACLFGRPGVKHWLHDGPGLLHHVGAHE